MRTSIFLLFTIFVSLIGFSQSPEAFSYQAVIRDGSGSVLANQNIGLRIAILEGGTSGTVVYSESFSITSNDFGLVNLEIGTGSVLSGDFSTINWGDDSYFVEVALDTSGGTSYTIMGTSQLLSVPYALYAKSSGDSKWLDGINSGIGYYGGTVGIGTLDALPTTQLLVATDAASDVSNIRIINENPDAITYMTMTTNTDPVNFTNNNLFLGINNSNSTSGPNEGFLWHANNYDLKFGTNNTERLRIKNTGNINVTTGDVYIENLGSGVIMKSPDGNCWRMTVDNSGNPVFTGISCP